MEHCMYKGENFEKFYNCSILRAVYGWNGLCRRQQRQRKGGVRKGDF